MRPTASSNPMCSSNTTLKTHGYVCKQADPKSKVRAADESSPNQNGRHIFDVGSTQPKWSNCRMSPVNIGRMHRIRMSSAAGLVSNATSTNNVAMHVYPFTYIYIYMCVCTYICTRMHMYNHMYTNIHAYEPASIFAVWGVFILLLVSPLSFSTFRVFMLCPMNPLQGSRASKRSHCGAVRICKAPDEPSARIARATAPSL